MNPVAPYFLLDFLWTTQDLLLVTSFLKRNVSSIRKAFNEIQVFLKKGEKKPAEIGNMYLF